MKDRLEKKRVELEQEERQKHTFHPQINQISDRINEERSKLMRDKQGMLSENLLHYEPEETPIGGSISGIQAEETTGLSYLERSGLFQEPFAKHPDRFKALFDDAKRRQERKDRLTEIRLEGECTFQPDIGINKFKHEDFHGTARPIHSSIPNRTQPSVSFYDRMVKRQKDLENKRRFHKRLSPDRSIQASKTLRLEHSLIDPDSGQELFKPKICRAPDNRPTHGKDIGSYLYSQHRDYEKNKESRQQEAQQKRDLMARGGMRPVS